MTKQNYPKHSLLIALGIIIGLLALIVLSPALSADENKAKTPSVIEQRVEVMKLMAGQMQLLHKMLSGEIYFEGDDVSHAVKEMKASAGAHLISLFPKGSQNAKSRAKDQIWIDRASFESYANGLQTAVKGLETTSNKAIEKGIITKVQKELPRGSYQQVDRPLMEEALADLKTMQQSFANIAQNCKGCHEKFQKAKKKTGQKTGQ